MSAIILDLEADQDRDFSISLIWFDQFGARVNLTDKSAVAGVTTVDGVSLGLVTSENSITLYTPEDSSDPNYGRIDFMYPRANLAEPANLNCNYELIIQDEFENVYDLIRGRFIIRPKVVTLE